MSFIADSSEGPAPLRGLYDATRFPIIRQMKLVLPHAFSIIVIVTIVSALCISRASRPPKSRPRYLFRSGVSIGTQSLSQFRVLSQLQVKVSTKYPCCHVETPSGHYSSLYLRATWSGTSVALAGLFRLDPFPVSESVTGATASPGQYYKRNLWQAKVRSSKQLLDFQSLKGLVLSGVRWVLWPTECMHWDTVIIYAIYLSSRRYSRPMWGHSGKLYIYISSAAQNKPPQFENITLTLMLAPRAPRLAEHFAQRRCIDFRVISLVGDLTCADHLWEVWPAQQVIDPLDEEDMHATSAGRDE